MKKRTIRRTFDKAFYERYYSRPSTAASTDDEVGRLARFVLSYLDYLGVRVSSVLDVGCGVGIWGRVLRRIDRSIEYTGIDPSEYLCREYGWTQSSLAEFRSRRKFDLVICQDVLQYLDGTEARAAIDSIARLCRGAFYLDVPTKEDFAAGVFDPRYTDRDIHVRSVRWYRRTASKYFRSAGGGVFLPDNSSTILLALEEGQ